MKDPARRLRAFIPQPWLYRTAVTLCSLVFLFLGGAWVWTFGFTSYRAHLAFVGLPLGLACLGFGVALLCMCRWAIILSLPLAALGSVVAAIIAATSGVWAYGVVVLAGGSYIALVSHRLFYSASGTHVVDDA